MYKIMELPDIFFILCKEKALITPVQHVVIDQLKQ